MADGMGLFGSLPRELRDMIFTLCLGDCPPPGYRHSDVVCGKTRTLRHPMINTTLALARLPAIAAVSEQIRSEVLETYRQPPSLHQVCMTLLPGAYTHDLIFRDAHLAARLLVRATIVLESDDPLAERKMSALMEDVVCNIGSFSEITDLVIELNFTAKSGTKLHIALADDPSSIAPYLCLLDEVQNYVPHYFSRLSLFAIWISESRMNVNATRSNASTDDLEGDCEWMEYVKSYEVGEHFRASVPLENGKGLLLVADWLGPHDDMQRNPDNIEETMLG